MSKVPALLADIGGTNVRFALVQPGSRAIKGLTSYVCSDFLSIADAVRHYLKDQFIEVAAFAVAAPISNGEVCLTNSAWRFHIADLQRELGLRQFHVINDFTATALAIPHLRASDLVAVGGGQAQPNSPIAVIGPGTGLGVSAVLPMTDGSLMALESEGGHVTMAAADQREAEILGILRGRFGHVSAERVISGQGLVNLYWAVCQSAGIDAADLSARQIADNARSQSCPQCVQALDLFFAMLGTVAGNLALTVGAKGGLVLAGGILPQMTDALLASRFRVQFEAKGRFCPWLTAIPTSLIVHADPAIIGLAGLL